VLWDEDEEVVVGAALGADADKVVAWDRDKAAADADVKADLRLPGLAVTAFAPVVGTKLNML